MGNKKTCRCTAPLRPDGTCMYGCAPLGSLTPVRRKNSVGVREAIAPLLSREQAAAGEKRAGNLAPYQRRRRASS